jgi:hypothetical protein
MKRLILSAIATAAAAAAQAQNFSLESAVLDSRTSRNLGVTSERGELSAVFRAQKTMTFGILRAAGIPLDSLSPEVRQRIERFQTTNLEAFRAFSLGLDLKDQGKFVEAKEAFRRAAELDPGFALAQEQQQAMPDANAVTPLQLRAVIAAASGAAVDRGKATFAVDLQRAMAALQAGQQVVTVQLPPDTDRQRILAGTDQYSVNSPGAGSRFSPNQVAALAYPVLDTGGSVFGLATANEYRGGEYIVAASNALESVDSTDAQGRRFQAERGGAAQGALSSATLAEGTRVYWGQWLSAPGASASVTVNRQPVGAPTLGTVDYMHAEATRQMPSTGTATFTPSGGTLGNASGTISVNFVTRNVAVNNLGFTLGGLQFSGLAGSATYSDRIASGAFSGSYTAGSCTGCAAFAPQNSAFGGNFVGRDAAGLIFNTLLLTGNGSVSGLHLFGR